MALEKYLTHSESDVLLKASKEGQEIASCPFWFNAANLIDCKISICQV